MFDSAKEKIRRAEYHISELEREFAAFVAIKPHKFVVQSDGETGDIVIGIKFLKELPSVISLVIGDAVHNLRCALDHVAWELAAIGGGAQDKNTRFIISGSNKIDFEAACNGIVTPAQWVKDAIKSVEAFPGGKGRDLVELNELDNADKHTAVTPVLRASGHPPFRVLGTKGEFIHQVEANLFIGGGDETTIFARVHRGMGIELDDNAECPLTYS